MEGEVWEIRKSQIFGLKYGNNFKRHVTPLPSILRSKPSSLMNSSLFLHSYPCPTKQKNFGDKYNLRFISKLLFIAYLPMFLFMF